jgi:hypothetical protein
MQTRQPCRPNFVGCDLSEPVHALAMRAGKTLDTDEDYACERGPLLQHNTCTFALEDGTEQHACTCSAPTAVLLHNGAAGQLVKQYWCFLLVQQCTSIDMLPTLYDL